MQGEIGKNDSSPFGNPNTSPLLFVICAQGLSAMLKGLEDANFIQGISFARRGPTISHLQFADDSLLLFKATNEECEVIKQSLAQYGKASGQLVNYDKSAVVYSPNTPETNAHSFTTILQVNVCQGHRMYLGLPASTMRSKILQFGYLSDRVTTRVFSWKNKLLSAGGKEVLLKSVIQSIPTYAMACFKIPISVRKVINRAMARFWWGDTAEKTRLHWTKWDELCRPKVKGGMGFRNLEAFNKSLLAKQVWRILENPELLVSKVLKARYFPHSDILEAQCKGNSSYIWKSLCWSRNLLQRGLCWKINNGHTTRILSDPFILDFSGNCLKSSVSLSPDTTVRAFIDEDGKWDEEKLRNYFWPSFANVILQVPIGRSNLEDQRFWKFTEDGKFNVKSGYLAEIGFYEPHHSSASGTSKEWNKLVWSAQVPPKVRIFIWRAYKGFIPVGIHLRDHHVPAKPVCEHCGIDWATTTHSLFFCERVASWWRCSKFWQVMKKYKQETMLEIGNRVHAEFGQQMYQIWVMATWMTWSFFCHISHNLGAAHHTPSIEKALELQNAFVEARKAFGSKSTFGILLGERSWRQPDEGVYRLDVDVAFDKSEKKFGVGAVIRNTCGTLIAALAKPILHPFTVLRGEICAAIEGLILSLKVKAIPLVIYSDSILAVKTLLDTNPETSVLDEATLEILGKAKSENTVIGIFHMYRSANRVAHSLAFFAKSCNVESIWMSNFPSWLLELASLDYN